MGRIQHRRSVSIRRGLYDALSQHCSKSGVPMSQFAERVLGEAVAWAAPAPEAKKTRPPGSSIGHLFQKRSAPAPRRSVVASDGKDVEGGRPGPSRVPATPPRTGTPRLL